MQGIIRHSFAKLNFDNLPDCLSPLNRISYDNFLYGGRDCYSIDNALSSVFPINDSYGYAKLEYVSSRIVKKAISCEVCRVKNISYVAKLYMTVRLILFDAHDHEKEKKLENGSSKKMIKLVKEEELYVCDIPIMNDNNFFVIDGVEKVVVSQIHRAPGVFFKKKMKKGDSVFDYSATIIPYAGSRIEFIYSSDGFIYFKIDKEKKMSLYHLFSVLSMSKNKIASCFYTPLELEVESHELCALNLNLKDVVGANLGFNIRDEKGDVLLSKGTVVSRFLIRKFDKSNKFYCKIDDLEGQFLYEDINIGNNILPAMTCLTADVLEGIKKTVKKGQTIKILNCNDKFFDTAVVNILNSNANVANDSSLSSIYGKLRTRSVRINDDPAKAFSELFFSKSRYNLMPVGRYKLNSVLGVNASEECLTLTEEDLIACVKKLIEYKNGTLTVDSVDSLTNRRVRDVGEIVYNVLYTGASRMAKNTSDRLNTVILDNTVPSELLQVAQISKRIRDFFLVSELCQYMEQNNLLSELTHIRKLSALGAGGITKDSATADVRDIHPTHYGRICPIETPDGSSIGLVTSLACYAKINKYGFIQTPYRKVVNGVITNEVEYLDACDEKKFKIACASRDIVSLPPDSNKMVSARYNEDFTLVPRSELDYVDVSSCQITSMMAMFVPFLESNDTARALMGCNMQRQAVPLLFKEAPVVATGFERKVAMETNQVIKAKGDGYVHYVDADRIIVANSDCLLNEVNENNENKQNFAEIYDLVTFDKTNQNTLRHQKPIVGIGERVKKGQALADCASTCNGEVSIGKNILLAFLPWNGYNYEDSVVISRRLVSDDKFTSLHIEEFDISVRDTANGAEEITRDILGVSAKKTRYLDETGIVQIGANVVAGDVLVGKVVPSGEGVLSSEEKLLKAVFGDNALQKKNESLYVPVGISGTVVDVQILTRRGDVKDARALQIEREEILKCEIRKNNKLSLLEDIVAKKINILLSGTSVKKNGKSYVFEELKSLKLLDKFNLQISDVKIQTELKSIYNFYTKVKDRIEDEYISEVEEKMDGDVLPDGVLKIVKVFVAVKSRLQPGDKISGRHGNKGVISRCVAVEDMPYMEDGTPIDLVFSPVSVPGRMNIGQILETHLGLISYKIGKKIDEILEKKNAAEGIKKILTDISSDQEFSKFVSQATDDEIVQLGQQYKTGLLFETPIFDGARIADFDRMAEKLGIDRSLQLTLYDGLTGEPFDRKVTVGYMYILKLHHLVDEKIHARSTGKYNLLTQQPIGGRANNGGQRFGEMECWALQAYGAAYTLQEVLTVKSDDVRGREEMYNAIVANDTRFMSGIPETFNILCREIRSLGMDIEIGFDN